MFVYQTVFQDCFLWYDSSGDHLTAALQGAEVRILKEDGFLGRKTTRVPRGGGEHDKLILWESKGTTPRCHPFRASLQGGGGV